MRGVSDSAARLVGCVVALGGGEGNVLQADVAVFCSGCLTLHTGTCRDAIACLDTRTPRIPLTCFFALPSLHRSLLLAGATALQQGLSGIAAAAAAGSVGAGGSSGGWSLTSSGEFWMLLAAQSMAVGTVMVRWVGMSGCCTARCVDVDSMSGVLMTCLMVSSGCANHTQLCNMGG